MERTHRIDWTGKLTFEGTSPEGHRVLVDGDRETGLSPMDMLLLGTGGCAAIDLVMILEKSRQNVEKAWVEIGGRRRDELPRYFTEVELHFVVTGKAIRASAVERAIELAMEKYCSASAQLAALAEIRTSYEIIES